MSSSFLVMAVLLSCTALTAFVLQPSDVEPAAVRPHSCQGGSWQAVRKGLLDALGLQTEPRLSAGGLDGVREQWRRTFSAVSHRVKSPASPALPSVSQDAGNSSSLTCCAVTSEIFMRDVGWDSWVIQPPSLTVVQCAACSPPDGAVQRPPAPSAQRHADAQGQAEQPAANAQAPPPCCRLTAHQAVPVVYMDQFSSVVISSVRLPRGCGCGPGAE